MDGGCVIAKIADVKEKWFLIKEKIFSYIESEIKYKESDLNFSYKYSSEYEKSKVNYLYDLLFKVSEYPNDIRSFDDKQILDLLKLHKYCDCPAIAFDVLVLGHGDNCNFEMSILSDSISDICGYRIETWT